MTDFDDEADRSAPFDAVERIEPNTGRITGVKAGIATYEFEQESGASIGDALRRQLPGHERIEWLRSETRLDVYRLVAEERSYLLWLLAAETTVNRQLIDDLVDAAERWSQLDHDGIAPVIDYGVQPEPWVLVERPAASILDRSDEREGSREAVAATLAAVLEACDAVEFAHTRGIVHGTLRPEVVAVGSDGDVRVDDWGLTRALGGAEDPTPFTAPEQLRRSGGDDPAGAQDRRTDVYRLGAVTYAALTGQQPYEATRPVDLREAIDGSKPVPPSEIADVPEEYDDPIRRAMATDPDDRFETVILLRNALAEAGESP